MFIQLGDFTGMDVAYDSIRNSVEQDGAKYGPRGKSCVELRPACFTIRHPQYSLYTGQSRRLNYRFYAIETLLYLAGVGGQQHAKLILAANPNMEFALNKDLGLFDGAYGQWLATSLIDAEAALERDLYTRQAVASIWSPTMFRSLKNSRDLPCTCTLQFLVERLHDGTELLGMVVNMRSNDINWGTPYDVPAFAAIQIAMAERFNLGVGTYTHIAGSLHYYEDGNSDGERPPTLAPRSKETWFSEYELLTVPTPDGHRQIVDLMGHCRAMVNVIEQWLDSGQRLSSFKLEGPLENDKYMQHWAWLIRFQHGKSNNRWRDDPAPLEVQL